jgi:hypothetical protein
MTIKLINNNGSGSVADTSPISYSYSEEVTSLEPSNLTGGTSQVNVSALSVQSGKVGDSYPDSKLLINNSMSLLHSESGEIKFDVKKSSVNKNVVSIIGDTLESRLNVEKTAEPHGGSGKTLLTAIKYYCGLGGISIANSNLIFEDGVDDLMDDVPVNFIGWRGNLWEHLKMLATAVSISNSGNTGFEFYINNDTLNFREAKTTVAQFDRKKLISQSLDIDSFDAAQDIEIYNYNTSYSTNRIVQDINLNRYSSTSDAQGATTNDSFQVNASESITRRFTINASLETVNQPVAVDGISPFPYPETGELGQYAISGADGVFIKASQWVGEGGSLKVSLTENPLEIEVTVTAPPKNGLENIIGGGELSFEPYRIGVETSGSTDYPAIYITGTGVFYNKIQSTIKTGASDSYAPRQTAPTIDNPFIINTKSLYSRGVAAAQAVCGPRITLTEDTSEVQAFGETPGSLRFVENNKYRIDSVSYRADGTNVTASPATDFDDFNSIWTGLTIEDFNETVIKPADFPQQAMKFNEFTIIPLTKPEVA